MIECKGWVASFRKFIFQSVPVIIDEITPPPPPFFFLFENRTKSNNVSKVIKIVILALNKHFKNRKKQSVVLAKV